MLPCLPPFAVHTDGWPLARFGAGAFGEFLVCRIAEDAARYTVAASVPDKTNLPKIAKNFPANTSIYLLGERLLRPNHALLSRNFPKKVSPAN
jgi:hypothetical protein